MTPERIAEWELTEADEAAIAALVQRAFPTDFGGRSFYKQRHHLRLVVRDGAGTITGHVGLTYRAIRMGEALVDIFGLADVATAPEHRGRGIASRLVEEARTLAEEGRAEFLILFGHRPLYAGAGFVPKSNLLRFPAHDDARSAGLMERRDEQLMVLPLGSRTWDDTAVIDLAGGLF